MKLAVTDVAAFMLTLHDAPETVSPPFHPLNTDSIPGVAVSVTIVPLSYTAEQFEPQLIPSGLEVTAPLPMPDFLTVSVKRSRVKVPTIDLDVLIVRRHVSAAAESQPLQVSNLDPATGVAVRVNAVPAPYDAVQVSCAESQSRPVGLEVTLPRPVPALLNVSVGRMKLALTIRSPLR